LCTTNELRGRSVGKAGWHLGQDEVIEVIDRIYGSSTVPPARNEDSGGISRA